MFRFSTRDLVWVTLLISVSLGWWRHSSELAARLQDETDAKTAAMFDRARAEDTAAYERKQAEHYGRMWALQADR